MSGHSLQDAARALAAALAGRLELRGTDPAGAGVDRALRQRVLSSYAQDLSGQPPEAAARWLLERLATLEARLLALQAAQWHGLEPPLIAPAAAPPPLPPVVAEEIIMPRHVVLPCDESMAREGFYNIEKGGNGETFCWMGPRPRGTVFIPRLAAPLEVRLHLQLAFVPEVLGQVRVSLDGGEWSGVRVEQEEGRTVLVSTPVPGGQGQPASMQLEIDAVRTDSPARRGASDQRELAIALWRIEVRTTA